MAVYKMPFNQYKAIQKMKPNEFSRWITAFADEMWQQGYSKACEDVPEGAVVIDTSDTMVVDYTDEDKMRAMFLSVPGVGPKLCEKIIDKIYETFDGYVSQKEETENEHGTVRS